MRFIQGFLQFIGRFCIAAIFIVAGIGKIFSWNQTLEYMRAHDMQMAELLIIGAIVVEVLSSFALAFGIRPKIAATVLLLYLIPVTYIFHAFWMIDQPAMREAQMIEFLKNLAIFGGLLCYVSTPQAKAKAEPKE